MTRPTSIKSFIESISTKDLKALIPRGHKAVITIEYPFYKWPVVKMEVMDKRGKKQFAECEKHPAIMQD